jgi:hypothetical protein
MYVHCSPPSADSIECALHDVHIMTHQQPSTTGCRTRALSSLSSSAELTMVVLSRWLLSRPWLVLQPEYKQFLYMFFLSFFLSFLFFFFLSFLLSEQEGVQEEGFLFFFSSSSTASIALLLYISGHKSAPALR